MRPITSVDPQVLGNLASDTAVDIFRELLWAEASTVGLGPVSVSVPCAITVADGGVDAEVTGSAKTSLGELVYEGITRYQIKTGAFSAKNKTEMRDLFLTEDRTDFKDRIRTCFEKGGTFVAVLFGSDLPDGTDDEMVTACQEFVKQREPHFEKCRIRILRQNQIAGLLNRHLALALRAQMKSFPNLRIHREWGDEIESLGALKLGAPQEAFLKQIQDELHQPEVVKHICVWGEPGVGKTRLLYEATAREDLASSVVYFRSPNALHQSNVIDEIKRDSSIRAILVVDDCDPRERQDIWSQLKALGPRLRLVTVQHDPYESSGTTVALQAPELADEQVSQIIQEYGLPKDAADRYAPYCGGSPRVADVVGWNLKNNPDDLTRPLDTSDVWNRFIEGQDDPHCDLVAQRKLTLEYIALFKRFGFGEPYQNEATAIAHAVQKADATVTWSRFEEIIHTLRRRRILQGETTLYITPRLLHIKLWRDWWDKHGESFSLQEFIGTTPDTLHQWFYEMFAYAHGSEAATSAVRRILSTHGSFVKEGLLNTEMGANFFLNLTEADTQSALDCLEATIGMATRDRLLEFTAGRQRIVWALEKIAVEKVLFPRAARLLLRLAEAENNPAIANNASGIFAGLFSLGPGRTAPTQATPAERFPILESALHSASKEQRTVALRGCDQALSYGHFMRMSGAERRGLNELELWSPKTYDEWFQAYEYVWNLLRKRVPSLSKEEQVEAARILLQRSYALIRIPQLAGVVAETVSELAKLSSVPRKTLLETVLLILDHSDDLPAATKERWQQIEKDIVGGDDFQARLKRHVALPPWRLYEKSTSSADPLDTLAREAVNNPESLQPQLSWLTTAEAESAHAFGYRLGGADRTFIFQTPIIDAVTQAGLSANTGLLGGYLRAMHEVDLQRWLSLLDDLSRASTTKGLVLDLVLHSGLTDDTAHILIRLVQSGDIPAKHLGGFIFGVQVRELSTPVFQSWIDLLLKEGTQVALVTALRLIHSYYRVDEGKGDLPKVLAEAVLLHQSLFEEQAVESRGANIDYDWADVAKKFLNVYPDRRLVVAERMLEGMGTDSIVMARFGHSYSHQILAEIAKAMPREVWSIATRFLGPPIDSRSYSITDWLKGDSFFGGEDKVDSILDHIPLGELWRWVDQDVEKRAWYLASFVPKKLFVAPEKQCMVREVLIRYGDRKDVQSSLAANFSTEGWMGSESTHHRFKKENLQDYLERESEPRVREWLHQYIAYLQRSIDRARIQEERED